MKTRFLLALTMAMATAAMFISPALSDMVGLPSMVVSATSNNTTPPTQTPPSQNRPTASGNNTQRPAGGSGAVVAPVPAPVGSTIAVDNQSGFGVAITTQGVSGLAGLAAGETLVPTVSPWGLSQAAVNRAMSLGGQAAYSIDISMIVPQRNANNNKVTQLSAPINIVLQRPEAQDGNTYDFMVIREHNGVLTNLSDLDSNPDTITISTDQFSVYTVIYAPKGVFPTAAGSRAKDSVPKTGDQLPAAVPVTVTVCLAALAMTAVALNKKKRA